MLFIYLLTYWCLGDRICTAQLVPNFWAQGTLLPQSLESWGLQRHTALYPSMICYDAHEILVQLPFLSLLSWEVIELSGNAVRYICQSYMVIDVQRHKACSVCTWSLPEAEEWDQACLTTGICFPTTDISTTSFQRQQCAGCYSQYCFSQTHSSTASYSNKHNSSLLACSLVVPADRGAAEQALALFRWLLVSLKQQVVDPSTSSHFFFFFWVCLLPITPNQPNCTPAWGRYRLGLSPPLRSASLLSPSKQAASSSCPARNDPTLNNQPLPSFLQTYWRSPLPEVMSSVTT